jgi:simple sugar transport system ATP-binding protein
MSDNIIVSFKGIEKHFGSVIANRNVSFDLAEGRIYALLGENGAGKSTLMNMLSGIYKPDRGEILLKGESVKFKSPKHAIEFGIGMIHQHFKLVDELTSLENIILGQEKNFFVNKIKLRKKVEEVCREFSLEVDLDKKIKNLSISEKQTVEIIKVLYRGAKLLVLDEPTAVLTPQETRHLFKIMKNMKNKGCTLIIITHKLHEIMDVSDEVIIMRKGEHITTVKTCETNEKELTDIMVGESLDLKIERPIVDRGEKLLEVKDLVVVDEEKVSKLKGISFDIYEGEVLGVAGLAGSGQKELCEAINGIQKVYSGDLLYEEKSLLGKNPREINELGISMSFIPEDRLGMGLVPSMSIVDNVILKDYYKQKGYFLSRKSGEEKSLEIIKNLNVKTPGIKHPVKELSGGNIQKILLGRELDIDPHLLVTAYPTRGLDIASSHLIYDLINERKKKGTGILYIGEDLDVLLEISDRIMVMCDGEITGTVEASKTSKEELGFLMTGLSMEEIEKKRGKESC